MDLFQGQDSHTNSQCDVKRFRMLGPETNKIGCAQTKVVVRFCGKFRKTVSKALMFLQFQGVLEVHFHLVSPKRASWCRRMAKKRTTERITDCCNVNLTNSDMLKKTITNSIKIMVAK